jgi:hypothetical protein
MKYMRKTCSYINTSSSRSELSMPVCTGDALRRRRDGSDNFVGIAGFQAKVVVGEGEKALLELGKREIEASAEKPRRANLFRY